MLEEGQAEDKEHATETDIAWEEEGLYSFERAMEEATADDTAVWLPSDRMAEEEDAVVLG